MATVKDDTEDKPLDPAVERVRARLVRFMIINLGILFIALMAVVIAIVYRSNRAPQPPVIAPSELPQPVPGESEVAHGQITLPAGARITSHTLSGNRLSLDLSLAGGGRAFLIYDIATSRVIARIDVATTQ